jgi:glycosyltransferase involved in cell wall biosynthesis
MLLSLVIPVYNNEENLPRLFHELDALAPRVAGDFEVVFVVDGSPDRSLAILQDHLPAWGIRSRLVKQCASVVAAITRGSARQAIAVIAADLGTAGRTEFQRIRTTGAADVVLGHRTGRAIPVVADAVGLFWRLCGLPSAHAEGDDVFACTRQVRDRPSSCAKCDR